MAAKPLRPEPMNVTTNHPKVKLNLILASPLFVAGDYICGKMEMDCRADQGLGIGSMMVELFAFQELHSRDHSATSNFIHLRRFFQGPGLPPSNAVQAHPQPGDPPLPPQYYQARRGHSTFLFRLPLPHTSPSSISFGSDLATVRYEVRASVGVSWKGERRVVTEKKEVEVVEAFDERLMALTVPGREPEAVTVGENGKIWMQGRIIGGLIVAGETACVELQVKNHSNKKNTGLYVTITRVLDLPEAEVNDKAPPLELTDTLTTIPFKGAEYIIPPGAEGVASLVFDVPRSAKGVKGGILLGDVVENMPTDDSRKIKESESIFEIRCIVGVKMAMGLGSKDILVEIPVPVVHPAALPELPPIEEPQPYPNPYPAYPGQDPYYNPYPHPSHTPGPYPAHGHPHQHYAHLHSSTPGPYPAPPQSPQIYSNIPPDRVQSPYGQQAYPPLPMSPSLGPAAAAVNGAYVDPGTNMVWLPPPSGYDLNGYEHGDGGEYQGEYYVPPIPTFHNLHPQQPQGDPYGYDSHHQPQPPPHPQSPHAYASPSLPPPPIPPPRPSSAGAYEHPNHNHNHNHDYQNPNPNPISPHLPLPGSTSVPGLPPASTTPGLSALGFGVDAGVGGGVGPSSPSRHDPHYDNYSPNPGHGYGGASVSRRPSGRARSVSPQRSPSRLQPQTQTHRQTQPQVSPQSSHTPSQPRPTTMSGSTSIPKLDLANLTPNPVDVFSSNDNANTSTNTPTLTQTLVIPKQSFTRVTTITPVPVKSPGSGHGSLSPGSVGGVGAGAGAEYFGLGLETKEVSKSERVEELERIADEVGRKKKDFE
ncbi:hypothetical protein D9758_014091 [Tetrapyrgos nigripes]|uniref:Arrestin C-terminal-like domain-containing protein n=1 Tax=Tetrapyrgos nigripes TaxID=182062 RepID=A0A8H5CIT4_9AGAR|nr:hypothetical protein D9758_014091 [Tetrapyrgos nigripes]